jgi:hypothetical protein
MAFDVHLPSRRISAVDFPRLGCEPPSVAQSPGTRTSQASEPPDDDPGIVLLFKRTGLVNERRRPGR